MKMIGRILHWRRKRMFWCKWQFISHCTKNKSVNMARKICTTSHMDSKHMQHILIQYTLVRCLEEYCYLDLFSIDERGDMYFILMNFFLECNSITNIQSEACMTSARVCCSAKLDSKLEHDSGNLQTYKI